MTDESCGCRCRDCAEHDIHSCGLDSCGYTKYKKKRETANAGKSTFVASSEAVEMLKGGLRVQFGKVTSPESKARLMEWARFVEETAGDELEIRQSKRAEKMQELFGRADYRMSAVTRREASGE